VVVRGDAERALAASCEALASGVHAHHEMQQEMA
jgi:hypothetical protein